MGMTSRVALPPIPLRPGLHSLSPTERIVLEALRQAVRELESGRRLEVGTSTRSVSSTGDRWLFDLQFRAKP